MEEGDVDMDMDLLSPETHPDDFVYLVPQKEVPVVSYESKFPFMENKGDFQAMVGDWLRLFEKNQLLPTHFLDPFRIYIPHFYWPWPNREPFKAEAREALFEPMEAFLVNGYYDLPFLETIGKFNRAVGFCGHVFKMGETTYTCRDCGLDPTCVLCVQCFNSSPHKNHRYKMSTSVGGGYCDCGDKEAWRRDDVCSLHQELELDDEDPGHSLPPKAAARAEILFRFLLNYCYDMLNMDHFPAEPWLKDDEALSVWENFYKENYGCILYNDETHTFDLVIKTLWRALDIPKEESIKMATSVDRDGRTLIKVSSFESCETVKRVMDRSTSKNGGKPLKTELRHLVRVAHDNFAIDVLKWLQTIIEASSGYRYVFYRIVIDDSEGDSFLKKLFTHDTNFWKSVRVQWHHLIITGLLKEYYMKRQVAKCFGENYADIMKDFVNDDHEHCLSISSLSVQIFTVPTLAHYLIEECDVFSTIMRVFMSECETRLSHDNKVTFERSSPNFKRTHYAIMDLKYLLTVPPKVWTPQLAKNFLRGMSAMVRLLGWLQDTDPVIRQLGTHLEYEPEWEAAFNTHMKLAPTIYLLLEWVATDQKVCIRTYRDVLKEIYNLKYHEKMRTVVREVSNHSATCYEYDISSEPVSIHVALTRFYAGLQVKLGKFGDYDYLTNFEGKPTPEIIMEPALRIQVLLAQTNSGMWKRNGYALLNQIFFYHNVRCRSDMYDKDIITLQIGASLIESNEFLIHLMNRMNILGWMDPELEQQPYVEDDNVRFVVQLVEEFLFLLTTLISARFSAGVGIVSQEDCIKKQAIQALCIASMPLSELNKYLDENLYGETGIERVIKDITTCKKSVNGDLYELKPEFYPDYDVFYHHYTREEMSKAEETQRQRKSTCQEPDFFPPPPLPPFTSMFQLVINVLKSDVFLSLITTVMERALKPSSRTFSDSQLRKVLHLIGYALNEEMERSKVEQQDFFQFTTAAKKWNVVDLLKEILQVPSFVQHKNMILWILKGFMNANPTVDENKLDNVVVDEDDAETERQRRKQLAAERRANLMAKMKKDQEGFRNVNADLFQEDEAELAKERSVEIPSEHAVVLGQHQTPRPKVEEMVQCILCQLEQTVGSYPGVFILPCYVQRSTVHCQNRQLLKTELTSPIAELINQNKVERSGLRNIFFEDPLFTRSDLLTSVHISCCGHIMHRNCYMKHQENIINRERRRPYRYRHPAPFDIEQHEILCPMCDCLSNAVIPIVPPLNSLSTQKPVSHKPGFSFDQFLQVLFQVSNSVTNIVVEESPLPTATASFAPYHTIPIVIEKERVEKGLNPEEKELLSFLWPNHRKLAAYAPYLYSSVGEFMKSLTIHYPVASPGLTVQSRFPLYPPLSGLLDTEYIALVTVYQGIAYTIMCIEMYDRDQGIPFFGDEVPTRQATTMKYLVRYGAFSVDYTDDRMISAIQLIGTRLIALLLNPDERFKCRFPVVLSVDAFTMLISLTFGLSSLFEKHVIEGGSFPAPPAGEFRDLFILRLVFTFHLVQILFQIKDTDFAGSEDELQEIVSLDSPLIPLLNAVADGPRVNTIAEASKIWLNITKHMYPFIRCCCKFYECLTGIPAFTLNHSRSENEFVQMLEYLGLPSSCNELLDSEKLNHYALGWIERCNGEIGSSEIAELRQTVIYPRRAQNLMSLPREYMHIINDVSQFSCQNTETYLESKAPTLCLICGTMLCSQSYCCQKEINSQPYGACNYHTEICGGGIGIFLRVRECKAFLIAGRGKGAHVQPPYVDENGETDSGLKRGNPLTLCTEKLNYLRRLWLNHQIPEEVARLNDRSTSILQTDWQTL